VDINSPHQSEWGGTPLHEAAEEGHLEVVQCLVQHGADKDKADNECYTPLCIAAVKGYLEVVQYLIQQGADKDKATNICSTPLHRAAGLGREDIVVCLLSHGAKLDVRNSAGKLPVDVATAKQIKQIIRDEEQRRRDVVRSRESQDAAAANDRLLNAVKRGDVDAVRSCCAEANVDINSPHQDELDGTALYAAVRMGHLEVVQCLIKLGADIDKANKYEWTPLFSAALKGDLAVVQCLLQHGADTDKADGLDWSPLYMAAEKGHLEVIQCLVQHGADKDKITQNGWTALYVQPRRVTWRWCSGWHSKAPTWTGLPMAATLHCMVRLTQDIQTLLSAC
jgi:ankyrin repeat protein